MDHHYFALKSIWWMNGPCHITDFIHGWSMLAIVLKSLNQWDTLLNTPLVCNPPWHNMIWWQHYLDANHDMQAYCFRQVNPLFFVCVWMHSLLPVNCSHSTKSQGLIPDHQHMNYKFTEKLRETKTGLTLINYCWTWLDTIYLVCSVTDPYNFNVCEAGMSCYWWHMMEMAYERQAVHHSFHEWGLYFIGNGIWRCDAILCALYILSPWNVAPTITCTCSDQ